MPALIIRFVIVVPFAALANLPTVNCTERGIKMSESSCTAPVSDSKSIGTSSEFNPGHPPLGVKAMVPALVCSTCRSDPSNVGYVLAAVEFCRSRAYTTSSITWCKTTLSRSAEAEEERRCALTSKPRRVKASLLGTSSVVRGLVLIVSARSTENIAARKEEKVRVGKATCRELPGGSRGREIKYTTVLFISTAFQLVSTLSFN